MDKVTVADVCEAESGEDQDYDQLVEKFLNDLVNMDFDMSGTDDEEIVQKKDTIRADLAQTESDKLTDGGANNADVISDDCQIVKNIVVKTSDIDKRKQKTDLLFDNTEDISSDDGELLSESSEASGLTSLQSVSGEEILSSADVCSGRQVQLKAGPMEMKVLKNPTGRIADVAVKTSRVESVLRKCDKREKFKMKHEKRSIKIKKHTSTKDIKIMYAKLNHAYHKSKGILYHKYRRIYKSDMEAYTRLVDYKLEKIREQRGRLKHKIVKRIERKKRKKEKPLLLRDCNDLRHKLDNLKGTQSSKSRSEKKIRPKEICIIIEKASKNTKKAEEPVIPCTATNVDPKRLSFPLDEIETELEYNESKRKGVRHSKCVREPVEPSLDTPEDIDLDQTGEMFPTYSKIAGTLSLSSSMSDISSTHLNVSDKGTSPFDEPESENDEVRHSSSRRIKCQKGSKSPTSKDVTISSSYYKEKPSRRASTDSKHSFRRLSRSPGKQVYNSPPLRYRHVSPTQKAQSRNQQTKRRSYSRERRRDRSQSFEWERSEERERSRSKDRLRRNRSREKKWKGQKSRKKVRSRSRESKMWSQRVPFRDRSRSRERTSMDSSYRCKSPLWAFAALRKELKMKNENALKSLMEMLHPSKGMVVAPPVAAAKRINQPSSVPTGEEEQPVVDMIICSDDSPDTGQIDIDCLPAQPTATPITPMGTSHRDKQSALDTSRCSNSHDAASLPVAVEPVSTQPASPQPPLPPPLPNTPPPVIPPPPPPNTQPPPHQLLEGSETETKLTQFHSSKNFTPPVQFPYSETAMGQLQANFAPFNSNGNFTSNITVSDNQFPYTVTPDSAGSQIQTAVPPPLLHPISEYAPQDYNGGQVQPHFAPFQHYIPPLCPNFNMFPHEYTPTNYPPPPHYHQQHNTAMQQQNHSFFPFPVQGPVPTQPQNQPFSKPPPPWLCKHSSGPAVASVTSRQDQLNSSLPQLLVKVSDDQTGKPSIPPCIIVLDEEEPDAAQNPSMPNLANPDMHAAKKTKFKPVVLKFNPRPQTKLLDNLLDSLELELGCHTDSGIASDNVKAMIRKETRWDIPPACTTFDPLKATVTPISVDTTGDIQEIPVKHKLSKVTKRQWTSAPLITNIKKIDNPETIRLSEAISSRAVRSKHDAAPTLNKPDADNVADSVHVDSNSTIKSKKQSEFKGVHHKLKTNVIDASDACQNEKNGDKVSKIEVRIHARPLISKSLSNSPNWDNRKENNNLIVRQNISVENKTRNEDKQESKGTCENLFPSEKEKATPTTSMNKKCEVGNVSPEVELLENVSVENSANIKEANKFSNLTKIMLLKQEEETPKDVKDNSVENLSLANHESNKNADTFRSSNKTLFSPQKEEESPTISITHLDNDCSNSKVNKLIQNASVGNDANVNDESNPMRRIEKVVLSSKEKNHLGVSVNDKGKDGSDIKVSNFLQNKFVTNVRKKKVEQPKSRFKEDSSLKVTKLVQKKTLDRTKGERAVEKPRSSSEIVLSKNSETQAILKNGRNKEEEQMSFNKGHLNKNELLSKENDIMNKKEGRTFRDSNRKLVASNEDTKPTSVLTNVNNNDDINLKVSKLVQKKSMENNAGKRDVENKKIGSEYIILSNKEETKDILVNSKGAKDNKLTRNICDDNTASKPEAEKPKCGVEFVLLTKVDEAQVNLMNDQGKDYLNANTLGDATCVDNNSSKKEARTLRSNKDKLGASKKDSGFLLHDKVTEYGNLKVNKLVQKNTVDKNAGKKVVEKPMSSSEKLGLSNENVETSAILMNDNVDEEVVNLKINKLLTSVTSKKNSRTLRKRNENSFTSKKETRLSCGLINAKDDDSNLKILKLVQRSTVEKNTDKIEDSNLKVKKLVQKTTVEKNTGRKEVEKPMSRSEKLSFSMEEEASTVLMNNKVEEEVVNLKNDKLGTYLDNNSSKKDVRTLRNRNENLVASKKEAKLSSVLIDAKVVDGSNLKVNKLVQKKSVEKNLNKKEVQKQISRTKNLVLSKKEEEAPTISIYENGEVIKQEPNTSECNYEIGKPMCSTEEVVVPSVQKEFPAMSMDSNGERDHSDGGMSKEYNKIIKRRNGKEKQNKERTRMCSSSKEEVTLDNIKSNSSGRVKDEVVNERKSTNRKDVRESNISSETSSPNANNVSQHSSTWQIRPCASEGSPNVSNGVMVKNEINEVVKTEVCERKEGVVNNRECQLSEKCGDSSLLKENLCNARKRDERNTSQTVLCLRTGVKKVVPDGDKSTSYAIQNITSDELSEICRTDHKKDLLDDQSYVDKILCQDFTSNKLVCSNTFSLKHEVEHYKEIGERKSGKNVVTRKSKSSVDNLEVTENGLADKPILTVTYIHENIQTKIGLKDDEEDEAKEEMNEIKKSKATDSNANQTGGRKPRVTSKRKLANEQQDHTSDAKKLTLDENNSSLITKINSKKLENTFICSKRKMQGPKLDCPNEEMNKIKESKVTDSSANQTDGRKPKLESKRKVHMANKQQDHTSHAKILKKMIWKKLISDEDNLPLINLISSNKLEHSSVSPKRKMLGPKSRWKTVLDQDEVSTRIEDSKSLNNEMNLPSVVSSVSTSSLLLPSTDDLEDRLKPAPAVRECQVLLTRLTNSTESDLNASKINQTKARSDLCKEKFKTERYSVGVKEDATLSSTRGTGDTKVTVVKDKVSVNRRPAIVDASDFSSGRLSLLASSNTLAPQLDGAQVWQKVSHILNLRQRSVGTQVKFQRKCIQGDASVDCDSNSYDSVSLDNVIEALVLYRQQLCCNPD